MDLSSLILPQEVLEHFSLIRFEASPESVNLYLDELNVRPEGDGIYLSKGFTPHSTIQDYPLRDKGIVNK
jgi:hypothetical protein